MGYHARVAIDSAAGPQTVAQQTWALFQRIFASERPRMMSIYREFDLVPPHVIALQSLDEPKPMGELAKILVCDSSNVTWITDRLEERGLVKRRAAPHDRRVKLLVLTPKGRRLRAELEERLSEPPAVLERLSDDDQRALRDLLARAVAQLEQA
jgi:DNA-binding MarR family transcriptional regulator